MSAHLVAMSLLLAAAAAGRYRVEGSGGCEDRAEAIYLIDGASMGRTWEPQTVVVTETLKGPAVATRVLRFERFGQPPRADPGARVLVYVRAGGEISNHRCLPVIEGQGPRYDHAYFPYDPPFHPKDVDSFDHALAYVRAYLRGREDPTPSRLAAMLEDEHPAVRRAGVMLANQLADDPKGPSKGPLAAALVRQIPKEPPNLAEAARSHQQAALTAAIVDVVTSAPAGSPRPAWWSGAALIYLDGLEEKTPSERNRLCRMIEWMGHGQLCLDEGGRPRIDGTNVDPTAVRRLRERLGSAR